MKWLIAIGDGTHFAGQSAWAALSQLAAPRETIRQLYQILIGSLLLGTIAGIALGAVVWMHTYGVLQRSGTQDYLPTVLAAAVLLELAPIGAGLIIAARTGASLGAELGAMKLGEQLDALQLLGLSPMQVLVGPRVLACMVALPLLHIFIAALALISGYFAENVVSSTTWLRYQTACFQELRLNEVVLAAMKTIVFGFLIAVASCRAGMLAQGGTEGVGKAATQAVVASSLLVLAGDVLLVALIQLIT
ncbi:MAG: ABC transporter permease [Zavarzinella sp.]